MLPTIYLNAQKSISTIGVMKFLMIFQVFNVYCIRAITDSYIPYCTLITGAATCILFVYHFGSRRINIRFILTKPLILWAVFIFYSLICSLSVAGTLHDIVNFAEKYVFIVLICYICYIENDISFPLKFGLIIALSCSLILLINSVSINGRIALSTVTGTNEMGNIAMTGYICLLMYKPDKGLLNNQIFRTIISILLFAATIKTASRQSLLLMIAAGLFRMIFCHRPDGIRSASKIKIRQLIIGAACIAIVLIILYIYLPVFFESQIYQRLTGVNSATQTSDSVRLHLYSNGFALWKKHPYFGVGFNNVSDWIGYSHSTYIEVLAGSGFFGAILFFGSFISLAVGIIKSIKDSAFGTLNRFNAKYTLFILLAVMLLATARAVHYYIISMLLISVLFAFDTIERSKKHRGE